MRRVVFALAFMSITACTRDPAPGTGTPPGAVVVAEDPAATRAAIEAINANMQRWYAAGMVDSIADAYTRDAWVMPPASQPIVSRDSIRAYWRGAMTLGSWRFTLATQDVAVAGEVAAERGKYALEFRRASSAPREAPPSFKDHGNYVVYWVKGGDRWLAKWDIAASDIPPARTK